MAPHVGTKMKHVSLFVITCPNSGVVDSILGPTCGAIDTILGPTCGAIISILGPSCGTIDTKMETVLRENLIKLNLKPDFSQHSGHLLKTPQILPRNSEQIGEENWGFWAILGNNLIVSGLNMTENAFYHLNIHFIL